MEKIRKGDQVVVISGRDKGRRGAVMQVLEDDAGARRERQSRQAPHQRQSAGQPAGRHHREGDAAAASRKVMLWNPGTKKGDRVGVKRLADGKKVRFFKSNGEVIDV